MRYFNATILTKGEGEGFLTNLVKDYNNKYLKRLIFE